MKWLFTTACFTLLVTYCMAQGDSSITAATCPSPKQCSRNLNNPNPALMAANAIKTKDYCYAKDSVAPFAGLSNNFRDVSYADFNTCGLPDDCVKDPGALHYRVFYPSDDIFTYSNTCKLPVLIYFHGGGFVDCNGSYLTPDLQTICTEFARRGFVTISVEYRTGVKLPPSNNPQQKDRYTAQQMLGIWRAGQDARGAIRTISQRETDGTEPYRIDLDNIFVGGNSAGSVAAMTAAYYNVPGLLGSAFPSNISNGNVLGNIDQDFYYGSPSITYSIKGVLDMWGGILIPQSAVSGLPETFFYQNGNMLPPTIAFCGKDDDIFTPTSKSLQFVSGTKNAKLRSESTCLFDQSGNTVYKVTSAADTYGAILGSQNIYEMLRRKQVYTEFYLDCQMGHGLNDNGPNFQSDFGTGLTNSTDVNLYIVKRAATFFQNVMNGKTYNFFPTTKFVECANDRHSCLNNSTTSCVPDSNPVAQACP